MVSFKGLTREEVLMALYAYAKPLGLGYLQYTPEPLTAKEAISYLNEGDHFDYLRGRVMKVRLKKDSTEFDERLYDRDNGQGAAIRAIDRFKERVAHE